MQLIANSQHPSASKKILLHIVFAFARSAIVGSYLLTCVCLSLESPADNVHEFFARPTHTWHLVKQYFIDRAPQDCDDFLADYTGCIAHIFFGAKNYVQIIVDVDHSMPDSTCVAPDLGARPVHSFKLCIGGVCTHPANMEYA